MLDQPYMTDLIEANSMGHEPNLIDIYSASWGPTDDGRTVDGPRNATMRAIVRGVNEGRNGLGNIYVWASGDGGEDDDCNCDGYAASMWTISINSAINTGENAHYDESCSSTLASTFSNGAKDPNTGVATTDLYVKCTRTHSGTSAAAPEAAGVFALALEAKYVLGAPLKTLACRDKFSDLIFIKSAFPRKISRSGREEPAEVGPSPWHLVVAYPRDALIDARLPFLPSARS